MRNGGSPAPRWSGPWSDDPVHDAEVAARLDMLQAGLRTPSAVDGRIGAGADARRGLVPTVRLRVGRALVAFGAFVEGPGDCAESTVARTA